MRTDTATFLLAATLVLTACSRNNSPSKDSAGTPPPATSAVSETSPSAVFPVQDLSKNIASGTQIPVQLKSVLDSSSMGADFVSGRVSDDVKGTDGRIAIPAGSTVTIVVRAIGKKGAVSELNMGLYAVNVAGRQYSLSTGTKDAATLLFTEDSGRGAGHTAVHLYYNYLLDFKLDTAVELR